MYRSRKNILISLTHDNLIWLEGALRVAGYNHITIRKLDDALELSIIPPSTGQRIELLIVEASAETEKRLKQFMRDDNKTVPAVLFIDLMAAYLEPYRIIGNNGWLYQKTALLAALKDLLQAPAEQSFKTNIHNHGY